MAWVFIRPEHVGTAGASKRLLESSKEIPPATEACGEDPSEPKEEIVGRGPGAGTEEAKITKAVHVPRLHRGGASPGQGGVEELGY